MVLLNIVTHALMLVVMTIVLISGLGERSAARVHSPFIMRLVYSDVILLAAETARWALFAYEGVNPVIHFFYVISALLCICAFYACLSLFIYFTVDFIAHKTSISFIWAHATAVVCAIYAVSWCISFFNGMFLRSVDGVIVYGSLAFIRGLGGYFVIVMIVVLMLRYRRVIRRTERTTLFLFMAIILFMELFPRVRAICSMYLMFSIGVLLIIAFIHIKQAQRMHEQELQLSQERLAIMLSQIRPHFIFNALNTIYALCGRNDSECAKKAVSEFSMYLRENLEVLENDHEILFEKELEHIKHYLYLEQLRFRENLRVVYNIQVTAFKLPPLTLQPLVENAIKHGLLQKKNGGTVTISTAEADDSYSIVIADDGVGFDVAQFEADSALGGEAGAAHVRSHIGIKNVTERLWLQSRATIDIKSIIGQGTTVTVRVPKSGVYLNAHSSC